MPAGGALNPLETYLLVNRVDALDSGVYRYLPVEHALCLLCVDAELAEQVTKACQGKAFVGHGALVFVWTAIPYRTEWQDGIAAHKLVLSQSRIDG